LECPLWPKADTGVQQKISVAVHSIAIVTDYELYGAFAETWGVIWLIFATYLSVTFAFLVVGYRISYDLNRVGGQSAYLAAFGPLSHMRFGDACTVNDKPTAGIPRYTRDVIHTASNESTGMVPISS
jgi:hypothetical protein